MSATPTIRPEVQDYTELRFESPGPGTWTLDAVHFPRPVTRYWAETHPAAFGRGTSDFARYYGMLIGGMQMTYVNGFAYNQPRPAPEEEIPQRFQRAEEVYEGKLWREQLRDWDENIKPASIAAHQALQAVDPEALSDDELVELPHALPGPSRSHDLPAHAFHGRRGGPNRRPPSTRGRLDRAPAGRAARADAWRGAGVRGRVRRARPAHRGPRSGPRCPGDPPVRRRPRRDPGSPALLGG